MGMVGAALWSCRALSGVLLEFIPTWTTMEEEAQNIADAEDDVGADVDMDEVVQNLQRVTQSTVRAVVRALSPGVQTMMGSLSPGSQEEAILDGRNCLATLRAEGRYEVCFVVV